ncbi:cation-independent mannose-6-phosphate receptor-like [Ptychodera flava]|uniref:cation-independent mannose-6-phosphate receptor-like n=1 Tax=Ptychodera flava TaxID=63121 RepID=UPI00396A4CB4
MAEHGASTRTLSSLVYFVKQAALLLILYSYTENFVNGDCTAGNYDLTPLTKWNWQVQTKSADSKVVIYHIAMCQNFGTSEQTECQGSSICKEDNGQFVNIGNYTDTLSMENDDEQGGFRLDFKGPVCQVPHATLPPGTMTGGVSDGDDEPVEKVEYVTTSINFRCGKTLGSPEFIEQSGCTYFFEWYSTVACKAVTNPAKEEVKCFVYDNDHNKRDLSPLVKTVGGYLVDSEDGEDLYINVCRDITPETGGATESCPQGSAACLIKTDTQTSYDMGSPSLAMALTVADDKTLSLHYEAAAVPGLAECNGLKPQVTIKFVCPQDEGMRGGGRDPVLLSNINCRYEIEWITEYACKTEYSVAKAGECGFTQENHGIDIDLSPLTKDPETENKYTTGGVGWDSKHYTYFINVCGTISMDCDGDGRNEEDAAVCQTLDGGTWGAVIGRNSQRILRYSDGELVLIYKHGAVCHHNGFQRTSVINFKCNKTAGHGNPDFVTEDECTYFFEWQTEYACRDHSRDSNCRVTSADGKKRYDLSPLVRTEGSNWEALVGLSESQDWRYFINVCGDILKSDPTTMNCPTGSAGCIVDSQGPQSLGKYHDPPVIDGNTLKLTYSDGSVCADGKNMQTVITFVCSPGDLESGPVLIRRSDGDCLFEFEWHTAAACPLGKKTGDDCKIVDEDAGLSFDLNQLAVDDKVTVTDSTDSHYEYYINVCKAVTGTDVTDCDNVAGACQKDITGNGAWKLGEPSKKLEYFDGVIRLVYEHGHPYAHTPPIDRKTEIAFLCKYDADPGIPEYIKEDNYTYSFKWYTKYACPVTPVECVVTDTATHDQYDLSSLSKAENDENWSIIDDTDPNNKKKYYINVCRSLNPVTFCDPYAAVCQTTFAPEEIAGISNMGRASSGPVVESRGNLMIEYTAGSMCTDTDGKKKPQTTRIHFICEHGTLASSPRFLEKVGNCLTVFTWNTEAACPIEDTTGEDCVVKDPNSDYIFNLQPLRKKNGTYYTVPPGNNNPSTSTFKINICNGVIGDAKCPATGNGNALTGACETTSDGQTTVLGRVNTALEFSDDGRLTLKYMGSRTSSGDITQIEITFLCRHNVAIGEPKFVRKEENRYLFDFETSLACLPESVDCLVSDMQGNQYDLSPLVRENDNWEAVDTRVGYDHLQYHINVCRPLNIPANGEYSCPGGPIGGCQTSSSDPKLDFNLGYVQSMPEAGIDGSVSIRYMNGDLCHGKFHRSTRINFECSETQGSPVFQEETPECEYVFSWETPSACALKQIVGSECKVEDPRFGYEFDLSPLRNTTGNYQVPVGKYKYLINVCGPLVGESGPCDGSQGVGSCQTQDANKVDAGKFNQNLRFEDGLLVLNYTTGKKCHNDVYERATLLQFTCDQSETGSGRIEFLNETTDCTYVFMWYTHHACPPYQVVSCSYRDDNGIQYDLTPLAKLSENYMVIPSVPTYKKETFYLNVCRSLLQKPGLGCTYEAAACLMYEGDDGKNRSVSLGRVTDEPFMENGHLVIRYDLGSYCPDGTDRKHTATINFECDEDAMGSEPQFSYSSENCDYYFIWFTRAACMINEKDVVTNDCTVSNPQTGFRFDLNVLSKEAGYSVRDGLGHEFKINVCSPIKDTQCTSANVGACQEEIAIADGQSYNAGNYNKNLFYDDGILFLNYSGGDPCHSNKFTRNTILNFVCAQDKDTTDFGSPVYIDESDDCTYFFSWHTPLVCETKVECSVMKQDGANEYKLDLSPLITERGHYLAPSLMGDNGMSSFYVNPCRPLNPIAGVNCPAGASACRSKPGEKPISIGHLHQEPYINGAGEVVLKYVNGTKCPEEPHRRLSTMITFHCLPGISQGMPEVTGYTDCTYLVEWETNVVCLPSTPAPATVDCTYYDSALEHTFDLSSLTVKDASTLYKVTAGNSEYQINVCSAIPGATGNCQNAGVCLKSQPDQSLGSTASQEFIYEEGLLKLVYSNGDTCPASSEKRQTIIIFECDESAGTGVPTLFSAHGECLYMFKWRTSLVCVPTNEQCATSYNGQTYDLTVLSQTTGDWEIKDEYNNVYFINLCLPVSNSKCPSGSSVCRRKPDGSFDSLGRVETQSMKIDSKDGNMKLLVEYSEGSNVCSTGTSRREIGARSVIEFQCAKVVGGPVITRIPTADESGVCEFYFEWKSHVACSTEREPVEMVKGKTTDPVSGGVIDLSTLMGKVHDVEGDIRDNLEHYIYKISLDGEGLHDLDSEDADCEGAAVCQVKKDHSFHRNVGKPQFTNFFMEADELEMVVSNPGTCGKDGTEDVNSTIVFHCDEDAGVGKPEFSYESNNCHYFFSWYTSAVCIHPKVVYPNEEDLGPGGRLSAAIRKNPKTVAIVIMVVLVAIGVCILLIVFHKPERRSAFAGRMRRCCCPAAAVPSYKYSKLAENDEESDLLINTAEREYDDESEDEILQPTEIIASEPDPPPSRRERRLKGGATGRDEEKDKKKKKSKSKKDEEMLDVSGTRVKNGPFKGKSIEYHDDSDEDMLNV